MKNIRRWGAVYILAVLFLASWLGQLVAMRGEIATGGWTQFWEATFENWQSEWLQLVFQAILLLGAKHWLFQVDAEDQERLEAKVDRLLVHSGLLGACGSPGAQVVDEDRVEAHQGDPEDALLPPEHRGYTEA